MVFLQKKTYVYYFYSVVESVLRVQQVYTKET